MSTQDDEDTVKKTIKGRVKILHDLTAKKCVHGKPIEEPCGDCEYETYEDEPEDFEE